MPDLTTDRVVSEPCRSSVAVTGPEMVEQDRALVKVRLRKGELVSKRNVARLGDF